MSDIVVQRGDKDRICDTITCQNRVHWIENKKKFSSFCFEHFEANVKRSKENYEKQKQQRRKEIEYWKSKYLKLYNELKKKDDDANEVLVI